MAYRSSSYGSVSTLNFELNNGKSMPAVGLGTFRIRHENAIFSAVESALEAGYRLFDTAAVYGNEIHLNKAFKKLLPKYGLKRKDIFVTTKLAPSNHGGPEITHKAYEKSLENLGLDYVDLFLIHFPGSAGMPVHDVRNSKLREKTWLSLVELYDHERVHSIGVSNFTLRHLNELMTYNSGIVPAVNQVEWHPYFHDSKLLQFCKEKKICLQAYSSLGGSSSQSYSLLEESAVKDAALLMDVSCPQILLAWALQKGVAIIPKSTNSSRIKENITLDFPIPNVYMEALDALCEKKIKYAWDPEDVA